MEIVFYNPTLALPKGEGTRGKNESNIIKLTHISKNYKDAFGFVINYCEKFGYVTPMAFSVLTHGEGLENKLYYYNDNDINAYLCNEMSLIDLLVNNKCDALVRNTEDIDLMGVEIDTGSLWMVRKYYAYYIDDINFRIPLGDLEHEVIINQKNY